MINYPMEYMMEFVICVLTNVFRIYLIRKFIQIFLGKVKQGKIKEIIVSGSFLFINTGLYLIFHLAWLNIITNLAGVSMMVFLYTKSIRKNLFVTCSIYLLNAGCDILAVLVFANYEDGKEVNQLCAIITVFLFFVCELLVEKIVSYRKHVDTIENLPLILVPLSSIVVIGFMIYSRSILNIEIVIVSIGLLIVNFLVFYLYNMLLKSISQKYENEMLKQKSRFMQIR